MTDIRSEYDVAYITVDAMGTSFTCDTNGFTTLVQSVVETFFFLLVWSYTLIMLAVPDGDIKWGITSLYDFAFSGLSWVGYGLAGTEFLLMEVYYDGAYYLCLGVGYVQLGLNYFLYFSAAGI